MSQKLPKDWTGPMKALAAVLREEGIKVPRWDSPMTRQIMLWGIKHLLFFKAHYEQKPPEDTYILTDGCMWEMNRQGGTNHAHAIEVVNERTGAIRYMVSGSRVRFVSGDISDLRSQAAYNARHAPKKS